MKIESERLKQLMKADETMLLCRINDPHMKDMVNAIYNLVRLNIITAESEARNGMT